MLQMSQAAKEGGQPMQVARIGVDLAKTVFQVHGITEDEEVAFSRLLRRTQMLPLFSKIGALPDWSGSLQQRT
jgi:hypothetical protein